MTMNIDKREFGALKFVFSGDQGGFRVVLVDRGHLLRGAVLRMGNDGRTPDAVRSQNYRQEYDEHERDAAECHGEPLGPDDRAAASMARVKNLWRTGDAVGGEN